MLFSLNDVYPMTSNSVPTSHETIAENEEREHYVDSTTTDTNTGKTFMVNKKTIFGGIGLLIGLVVLLNFLD